MRLVSEEISEYFSNLSPHNSMGVLSCSFHGHIRSVADGHPRTIYVCMGHRINYGFSPMPMGAKPTFRLSFHLKGFKVEHDLVTRRNVNEPMALKGTGFLRSFGIFFWEVGTVDDSITFPRDICAAI